MDAPPDECGGNGVINAGDEDEGSSEVARHNEWMFKLPWLSRAEGQGHVLQLSGTNTLGMLSFCSRCGAHASRRPQLILEACGTMSKSASEHAKKWFRRRRHPETKETLWKPCAAKAARRRSMILNDVVIQNKSSESPRLEDDPPITLETTTIEWR